MCCLDNNQKGHNLKYQQFGKSNKYAKVTGSIIIKCNHCDPDCYLTQDKIELSHAKQPIPSAFMMPHYELLFDTNNNISPTKLIQAIIDITQIKAEQ